MFNLMRISMINVQHSLKKLNNYYIPKNLKVQEKQQTRIYDTLYLRLIFRIP